jgi:hypothetical protein
VISLSVQVVSFSPAIYLLVEKINEREEFQIENKLFIIVVIVVIVVLCWGVRV